MNRRLTLVAAGVVAALLGAGVVAAVLDDAPRTVRFSSGGDPSPPP